MIWHWKSGRFGGVFGDLIKVNELVCQERAEDEYCASQSGYRKIEYRNLDTNQLCGENVLDFYFTLPPDVEASPLKSGVHT